MTDQHTITPSLELLKHWEEQHFDEGENYDVMLIQAYQAGADAELEACCEWLRWQNLVTHCALIPSLRAARRPKPPSLKEQALEAMDRCDNEIWCEETERDLAIIRTALEQLND